MNNGDISDVYEPGVRILGIKFAWRNVTSKPRKKKDRVRHGLADLNYTFAII